MKVWISLVVVLVALIIFYIVLRAASRCHKRTEKKKVSLDTYSKLVTTAVVAHGMILTTWSYILACFDKDPVVDVSSTIVREIVAPVVMYLITNTIMNIFEKNKMSFSEPIHSTIISNGRNEEQAEPEEAER